MALLDPPKLGGMVWTTPRGSLRCWTLAPDLVVVKMSGHVEKELAPRFIVHFERTLPGPLRAIFFDAGEMEGYDTAVRVELTEWAQGVKQRTGALHVWVQSKLVRMGVAVANLALGGVLRVHPTRAAMETSARKLLEAENRA